MKNNILTTLLGSSIIGVSIIISGVIIANNLPDTTRVPAGFSVTATQAEMDGKDFLSEEEVAVYLGVTSDDVASLIKSGELDPFGTKIGSSYIFSKVALEGWMNTQISFGVSR